MAKLADPWFAADKLEHLLACFAVTLQCTYLASRVRRLSGWKATLGAAAGLLLGSVKEAADYLQVWSNKASIRDAVADGAGVVLAICFVQMFLKWKRYSKQGAVLPVVTPGQSPS